MPGLPHPDWLIAILRPLNNRWTWRIRLRILLAMEPAWFRASRQTKTDI